MVDFYLQPPAGSNIISEIYNEEICVNAKFILDRPLPCPHKLLMRLIDGQWFLVINNREIMVEGRWAIVTH